MKLVIAIIILAILAFSSMFFLQNMDIQPLIAPPVPLANTPTPPVENSTNPTDWKTYTGQGFSISYPPDMQISENPTRLTLLGPTQTGGTEVYDGVILIINDGAYTQDSLFAFVEAERKRQENDPAIHDTSSIQEVSFVNNNGYEFTIVGLGTFTQYYFPKGESGFLHVSMLLEDPSNQGFRQIADTMLSSLH